MSDIGELSVKLFRAKQAKTKLNEQLKELNKEIDEIGIDLLHALKDQGLTKVANEYGTVYINTQTRPKVVNWEEFLEYIYENKAGYLLERRPSQRSFIECVEEGIQVPGVDPYTYDEVRTRSS